MLFAILELPLAGSTMTLTSPLEGTSDCFVYGPTSTPSACSTSACSTPSLSSQRLTGSAAGNLNSDWEEAETVSVHLSKLKPDTVERPPHGAGDGGTELTIHTDMNAVTSSQDSAPMTTVLPTYTIVKRSHSYESMAYIYPSGY